MSNTDADTAISALDKLIAQELAAVRAASRDGNRPLYESSSIRYHAYLTAKDEIRKALAGLLSDGWSVMRTDVLPGLGGKGEYEVEPNICYEPSFPPTIVYILEKEAE
ncbi:hypothetical protein [Bifidobacterium adolescentis]|uniref:hypothetical protein n=1 Tax=Bifidobacterium adolescentis TaxID=1680 RepID=UPI004063C794